MLKKESLRAYSFLKFAKMVPASIVYDIILLFTIEKKWRGMPKKNMIKVLITLVMESIQLVILRHIGLN